MSTPPGSELVPQQPETGDDRSWAALLSGIIAPLAEADRYRADRETERYKAGIEAQKVHGARAHVRFLVAITMVFTLVLGLLIFASYAFATGSIQLATHLVTGVVSLLAGLLAGVGIARTR